MAAANSGPNTSRTPEGQAWRPTRNALPSTATVPSIWLGPPYEPQKPDFRDE